MFSNELVVDILKYLDTNLYSKITIADLSNHFNYNKDYIMRIFKREIGLTIFEYINKKRIYNSLKEYNFTTSSILNISLNYGFYSQEYYSETFHKIIGVSPRTYQKFIKHSKNLNNTDINKILASVTSLEYSFRIIDTYQLNIKPKRQVKILSIFK